MRADRRAGAIRISWPVCGGAVSRAEVSLGLRAILEPSETHADDILAQSVGYDRLVDEVVRISALSPFGTLEALAETIGKQLLEKYNMI